MADKEYIEREKALDVISEWLMKALHQENMSKYNEGERAAYRTALSEIAELPAADVRPVVRGKWERMPNNDVFGDIHCKCSACGEDWWQGPGWFRNARFCPNCGANLRPTSMSGANGEKS